MDQIETGKFIARERKGKGLTQQQLAQRLGISNRTISKWECGKGFPEVSLLLPLCQELEVSVNELLSGRRLQEQDYQKKAEEHMIDFMKEREENLRRFWIAILTGIIATVSFLTLLEVVCVWRGDALGDAGGGGGDRRSSLCRGDVCDHAGGAEHWIFSM